MQCDRKCGFSPYDSAKKMLNIQLPTVAVFFFRITQYIRDTHNAHTLIPMNTRTQTLPLVTSSKTVPANPQD
jgi:hypothetical protein